MSHYKSSAINSLWNVMKKRRTTILNRVKLASCAWQNKKVFAFVWSWICATLINSLCRNKGGQKYSRSVPNKNNNFRLCSLSFNQSLAWPKKREAKNICIFDKKKRNQTLTYLKINNWPAAYLELTLSIKSKNSFTSKNGFSSKHNILH